MPTYAFCGSFCPIQLLIPNAGSGSSRPKPMRIRIHNKGKKGNDSWVEKEYPCCIFLELWRHPYGSKHSVGWYCLKCKRTSIWKLLTALGRNTGFHLWTEGSSIGWKFGKIRRKPCEFLYTWACVLKLSLSPQEHIQLLVHSVYLQSCPITQSSDRQFCTVPYRMRSRGDWRVGSLRSILRHYVYLFIKSDSWIVFCELIFFFWTQVTTILIVFFWFREYRLCPQHATTVLWYKNLNTNTDMISWHLFSILDYPPVTNFLQLTLQRYT